MYGVDKEYRTVKEYAKAKIKMLREDFKIRVTKAEAEHAYSLTSEIEVDSFCRKMFEQKL